MKTNILPGEMQAGRHTLAIDGMSGDACVTKVTTALKTVSTVTTESVAIGSAVIGANQQGCDAACCAINGVGYRATEDTSEHDAERLRAGTYNDGKAGTDTATDLLGDDLSTKRRVGGASSRSLGPQM